MGSTGGLSTTGTLAGASSSSSKGSRSNTALAKEAAIKTTGPDAIKGPTTDPPTTCPCPPDKNIEIPLEAGGAGGGSTVPERLSISKRPWSVTTLAAG
uniref:Uncharacterized protein n=1 Tax=Solanum lycopersicum TaxID=4081 RepID=A0A3Q7H4A6_SOLLC